MTVRETKLRKGACSRRGESGISDKKARPTHFGALTFLVAIVLFAPPVSWGQSFKAKSALVIDATTGQILFWKEPDLQLPPASTTKLMTAIVTMENATLDQWVTISKNAARVPPYKMGLRPGDRATIESLLYAALLKSSNDAAVALAEGVAGSEEGFVQMMNQKAFSLGARNTRFSNPHGLPGPDQHTTVSDLALIMLHAMAHPKLREIIETPMAEFSTEKGKVFSLKSTNKLLWSDESLVGGKTGFTVSAGHCFVCVAERENRKIIVSILGSPSRKLLWKETQQLIDIGFKVLAISLPAAWSRNNPIRARISAYLFIGS